MPQIKGRRLLTCVKQAEKGPLVDSSALGDVVQVDADKEKRKRERKDRDEAGEKRQKKPKKEKRDKSEKVSCVGTAILTGSSEDAMSLHALRL